MSHRTESAGLGPDVAIDTRVHIGTAGWSYEHWREVFYPEDMPAEQFLDFYSRQFRSVEINTSFYHLPSVQALRSWYASVPHDFVFAAKASRYITHMKKLKDPDEGLARYLGRMEALEDKLGPIIFQLPPKWRLNLERLTTFLTALPRSHRYAMEFRDPSWIDPRVMELLEKYRVAFCIYDLDFRQSPRTVTADIVYVRLHGPEGPYCGQYDDRALSSWAEAIRGWLAQSRQIFFYFDNDEAGYAPQDALRLEAKLNRTRRKTQMTVEVNPVS